MEILKNWSTSIPRSEKNIFPLMKTLVERGVISLANEDMDNLSIFYEESDPDKIQGTLARIVGDARKEEAGFWLLITAVFIGSCRNNGDLEAFLARFAQQRDHIRRLFSRLQEDTDLSLKMKAKIGGDLLTALQKSPPECADDLFEIANILLPVLKMAAQGGSSLASFEIRNNLPPEDLDAATFSKCLRFFEAVAVVAMFEPSVLERELSAAVNEVKQWHAEGRLHEMLEDRELQGALARAKVDAAEGSS